MSTPKSLPARVAYVLFSTVVGAIVIALVAGAWIFIQGLMSGGVSDETGYRLGRGLSVFAIGVGVPLGALLGAFILQDSAKLEDERRGLGLCWIVALAIAGLGIYVAFGQGLS